MNDAETGVLTPLFEALTREVLGELRLPIRPEASDGVVFDQLAYPIHRGRPAEEKGVALSRADK